MKTYKINEIFYSIQGEGMYTGFPAVFVRFSGCNTKCLYCDTLHESGEQYSVYDVIDRIRELTVDCKRVVITGGEPLQQLDKEFVDILHINKFIVHLETNGSIVLDFNVDWVTVSPKQQLPWKLTVGNELKVVYEGQDLSKYFPSTFQFYFLQPCSMKNIKETMEQVQRDPRWCLSIQQQKILNIQ